MQIEETKINNALGAAHKKAGHHAYFGNGFRMGVEFALKELDLERLLGAFYTHGQESVTCDNCGSEGTGLKFKELYQKQFPTT